MNSRSRDGEWATLDIPDCPRCGGISVGNRKAETVRGTFGNVVAVEWRITCSRCFLQSPFPHPYLIDAVRFWDTFMPPLVIEVPACPRCQGKLKVSSTTLESRRYRCWHLHCAVCGFVHTEEEAFSVMDFFLNFEQFYAAPAPAPPPVYEPPLKVFGKTPVLKLEAACISFNLESNRHKGTP